MLINEILFNSEAWHGITNVQIEKLESVYEALLGGILEAHINKPKKIAFRNRKCSTKVDNYQRRLNYLKHILRQ